MEWQYTVHNISMLLELSKEAHKTYKANPTKANGQYFTRLSQEVEKLISRSAKPAMKQ